MVLSARTKASIHGSRNAWSLAETSGYSPVTECEVSLTIEGDEKNGYHLVMHPAGFFAADTWHRTKDDALTAAADLFGVSADQWTDG